MEFKNISTNRIIIHKIIGKTRISPAYCIESDELHSFDEETSATFLTRIYDAVRKSNRFFETKVENTSEDSFFFLAKKMLNSSDSEFIDYSKKISYIATDNHQHTKRPGGLLIVVEGTIDKKEAILIIKAELQEALTLKGNAVELIKELFLSPAKEFFKIGFLIRKKNGESGTNFKSFIYDDNFNPRKDDLAFYFYNSFLGFSTSENDKLNTNNFLKDYISFVDKNIDDFETRKNLKIHIKAIYRESSNLILDPRSFLAFFDFDPTLKTKFHNQIITKYNRTFTKDLTLVDNSLKNGRLDITANLKLIGPSDLIDRIEIFDPENEVDVKKLTTQIDSGQIKKIVTLNEGAVLPDFNDY